MDLIKSVIVIDTKNLEDSDLELKIKSISNKRKEGELYLLTTLSISASIETYEDGQLLNIVVENIDDTDELDEFCESLSELRDYYPNLTIKITDKMNIVSSEHLPEDTILK